MNPAILCKRLTFYVSNCLNLYDHSSGTQNRNIKVGIETNRQQILKIIQSAIWHAKCYYLLPFMQLHIICCTLSGTSEPTCTRMGQILVFPLAH